MTQDLFSKQWDLVLREADKEQQESLRKMQLADAASFVSLEDGDARKEALRLYYGWDKA